MAMHKPGDTITPASFAVAPELLGVPLASPSRRLAAMIIDLLLLGILVNAGGLFFGIAAAFAIWRASDRAGLRMGRPRLRKVLRFSAAAVLFIVVVTNWGFWTRPLNRLVSGGGSSSDDDSDDSDSASVVVATGKQSVNANITGWATVRDLVALRRASNDREARKAASRLVERVKSGTHSPEELKQLRSAVLQDSNFAGGALPPAAVAALRQEITAQIPADSADDEDQAAPTSRDSLAAAYVRALTRRDTDRVDDLRPRLVTAFAGDTLAQLGQALHQAQQDKLKLERKVKHDSARAASKAVGFMETASDAGGEILRLLRKAGLGFGWLGLYFTGFVALMRGQTPGKRLLGIRIVRLDGRPMGWWAAMERFGGYAASVVTALGGFFQILWDKNRQAMHDKIAETVVVRV